MNRLFFVKRYWMRIRDYHTILKSHNTIGIHMCKFWVMSDHDDKFFFRNLFKKKLFSIP